MSTKSGKSGCRRDTVVGDVDTDATPKDPAAWPPACQQHIVAAPLTAIAVPF
jgi:hypothetical protein